MNIMHVWLNCAPDKGDTDGSGKKRPKKGVESEEGEEEPASAVHSRSDSSQPSTSTAGVKDKETEEITDPTVLIPSWLRALEGVGYGFQCCWLGCGLLFFPDKSLDEPQRALELVFKQHMLEHCKSSTLEGFKCGVVSCWFECESQEALDAHVFYHAYHAFCMLKARTIMDARLNGKICKATAHCNRLGLETVGPFVCNWDECGSSTTDIHGFVLHIEQHAKSSDHTKKKYHCEWTGCKGVFSRKTTLRHHVVRCHGAKEFACSQCGVFVFDERTVTEHVLRQYSNKGEPQPETADEDLTCKLCGKTFQSNRLLFDHVRHHLSKYRCPHCNWTSPSPSALKRHVLYTHNSEKHFRCDQCIGWFKTEQDLDIHQKGAHNDLRHKCDQCDKSFKWKSSLVTHKQTHKVGEKRLFACHFCSKRYLRGGLLTAHLAKEHQFYKPPGYARFMYRKSPDGLWRAVTERYEYEGLAAGTGDSARLIIDEEGSAIPIFESFAVENGYNPQNAAQIPGEENPLAQGPMNGAVEEQSYLLLVDQECFAKLQSVELNNVVQMLPCPLGTELERV